MAVLLPNARLGLRRRVEATPNAYGERVAAGWGPFEGPYDGRTSEAADATWSLGVDPALWPVRAGDLIISLSGGAWLVQTADLLQNNYDSTVDWVRVAALRRTPTGGTVPADAWSVSRYADAVEPALPETGEPRLVDGTWVGIGPPPAPSGGYQPTAGDDYLDLNTGVIYTLGGGA